MKLLVDIPEKIYKRVARTPRCANILEAFDDRDMFVKALQTGIIVNTVQNEINLSGTTNGDIVKAMFPNWEIEQIKNRYDVKVDSFTRFSFNKEWWNAPYDETEKKPAKANLRFKWVDSPEIGKYKGLLYEGKKVIDEISFTDYTSEFHQKYDQEGRYTRPYSFEVNGCSGWSMREGFDYDIEYDSHYDKDGNVIGGYQGNCTHTVDDIKKWCENWIAQGYLKTYYRIADNFEQTKARAEWFESQGFTLEKEENV